MTNETLTHVLYLLRPIKFPSVTFESRKTKKHLGCQVGLRDPFPGPRDVVRLVPVATSS